MLAVANDMGTIIGLRLEPRLPFLAEAVLYIK
jgi:hypothetical protein